jgi:hypothetical protein
MLDIRDHLGLREVASVVEDCSKLSGKLCTGSKWLRISGSGFFEQDNKPSGLIKNGEFVDLLSDCPYF